MSHENKRVDSAKFKQKRNTRRHANLRIVIPNDFTQEGVDVAIAYAYIEIL